VFFISDLSLGANLGLIRVVVERPRKIPQISGFPHGGGIQEDVPSSVFHGGMWWR
jgi:hypothetical protein